MEPAWLRSSMSLFILAGGKRKGEGPKRGSSYTSDRSSRERASVHHLLRALHWGRITSLCSLWLHKRYTVVQLLQKQNSALKSDISNLQYLEWNQPFHPHWHRQSSWTALTASAVTALSSGAKRRMSVRSADSPYSLRPAAWPWTTASTAWWKTWAWTWRPGGRRSSLRGKVRGASPTVS